MNRLKKIDAWFCKPIVQMWYNIMFSIIFVIFAIFENTPHLFTNIIVRIIWLALAIIDGKYAYKYYKISKNGDK